MSLALQGLEQTRDDLIREHTQESSRLTARDRDDKAIDPEMDDLLKPRDGFLRCSGDRYEVKNAIRNQLIVRCLGAPMLVVVVPFLHLF